MSIIGLVILACLLFISLFALGYAIVERKFWWGFGSVAASAYCVWLGIKTVQCLIEFGI